MISLQYDGLRPAYYLRKWKYYEVAKHELSGIELDQAKVFFNALKQLNDHDRQILTDAYYCSKTLSTFKDRTGYYHSLIPIKDKLLAKKYGVTIDRFGNMRRIAQMNLKKEMQNILNKISNFYKFRMNTRLYLVNIKDKDTLEKQYVLGSEHEAMIFNEIEDVQGLFINLLLLGFEKIPVK